MVRRECCRLKAWVTNLFQHSYFADHSNLEESELLQDTFRYGREEPTVEAGHEKGYSLSFTWQSTDSQYLSQPTQVSTFPYASNTTIFRKIIGFYRLLVPSHGIIPVIIHGRGRFACLNNWKKRHVVRLCWRTYTPEGYLADFTFARTDNTVKYIDLSAPEM